MSAFIDKRRSGFFGVGNRFSDPHQVKRVALTDTKMLYLAFARWGWVAQNGDKRKLNKVLRHAGASKPVTEGDSFQLAPLSLRRRGKQIPRSLRQAVARAQYERVATGVSNPKIERESFVLRANRLEQRGRVSAALDLIYDSIDELMRIGEFDKLDTIIRTLPVSLLAVDVLLGILTATLPGRTRLSSRPSLYQQVEKSLRERGEYEDGLLVGLKG